MNKKVLYFATSLVLVFSLSACNGVLQVAVPTATPQPQTQQMPADTAQPTQSSSSNNSGDILFGSLANVQSGYEQIYTQVAPSVVTIDVILTVSQTGFSSQPLQQAAAGSGIVWDTDGHIVTNNHVVNGATSITVTFHDGTIADAQIVGTDASSDLAVIQVNVPKSELKPIEVMDSTTVKVGQLAIAIGNPFQLADSMSTGIISGTGRSLSLSQTTSQGLNYTIPDIIQTDAAINPGSSGGALVDIQGQLIGITSAIESPDRGNSGVGYVIPSIIVSKIAPVLISKGTYEQPYIGISGTDMVPEIAKAMNLDPNQKGALIIQVTPGSPAAQAGLQGSNKQVDINGTQVTVGGDVITGVDNTTVNVFEDLTAYLARYTNVGQTINLQILRNGKSMQVPVTLAARPAVQATTQPQQLSGQAYMGIQIVNVDAAIAGAMNLPTDTTGVLVEQVASGSPAADAGLQGSTKAFTDNGQSILIGGDIITALDNQPIDSANTLSALISQLSPGDTVVLSIIRGGATQQLELTLGTNPNG